jgi:hypothetical protein
VRKTITCPIGGATFKSLVAYSAYYQGKRLDLRPFGNAPSPLPVSQCPRNGFVMYQSEFSADEIAKLRPIVLGADYRNCGERIAPTSWPPICAGAWAARRRARQLVSECQLAGGGQLAPELRRRRGMSRMLLALPSYDPARRQDGGSLARRRRSGRSRDDVPAGGKSS